MCNPKQELRYHTAPQSQPASLSPLKIHTPPIVSPEYACFHNAPTVTRPPYNTQAKPRPMIFVFLKRQI